MHQPHATRRADGHPGATSHPGPARPGRARGPGQPGGIPGRRTQDRLRDAHPAGRGGQLHRHRAAGSGVPRPHGPQPGQLELPLPGRLRARLQRADPAGELPDPGQRGGGDGRVTGVRDRLPRRALPPARAERRAVLHLRARRRGRRAFRHQPAARQPDRPACLRLRVTPLRQQRQPARQAAPGRRAGQRGRRLVRCRRRLREVHLHQQLRRRADAARGPRLPRHLPGAGGGGRLRAQLAGEDVEPGGQGGVHPGRNRHRQREQHDPGRLQLLVPAAGRRPHQHQQGGPSRPHRLLREIPAGVRGGPAGGADQPRLRRPARPTTPSAPSWRRSRTRPAPSTCWRWPAASTPWPRPATSARS